MIEDIKYLSQRITEREKLANKKEWAKKMINFICHQHLVNAYHENRSTDNTVTVHNQHARMLSNYQLYNNIINQKDFERECNPLGLQVGQFKEEIHPYNKTYNKIQVLLGEELKRPFDYTAVTVSEDGVRQKMLEKDEMIRTFMEDIVTTITQQQSELAKGQLDPNMPEEEKAKLQQQLDQQIKEKVDRILNPKYISKALNTTASQKREIVWAKILKYLVISLNILDKKNDGFKHGLLSGLEAAWVGIENGEPCTKVLNSIGLIYDKSPDTKWIQDGNYAGYKTSMSITEIIAQYGDDLEDDDLKSLEERLNGGFGSSSNPYNNAQFNPEQYFFGIPVKWENYAQYGKSSQTNHTLNVYHVEWKSLRKVYFLKYTNAYQETQVDIVDAETFYIPEYAVSKILKDRFGKSKKYLMFDGYEVETRWITDVWEGVRIGNDIFTRIGRKNYQFRNADNPNNVKLGYHGVAYSNMNSPIVSMMDRMKPFQYLYFIIMHRLKEMIAKDKGKLFHLDVTMIDPELGLEKTLYYLDKLDIDFFNPLHNANVAGAGQRGKITSATDRSNMQHIMNYVQLLNAIDEQISDVAGVTKQREGSSSPYETATASQNSIIQSTHITEIYFHTHAKLWECVLNSLVQVTQECWKYKGIRKQFVLDDLSIHLIEATPEDLTGADMAVFISNARKDQEIFQKIEKLSEFALSSGQAKLSDIVTMFKASSIAEMEVNIKTLEDDNEKRQQAQQQAEMENNKQIEQAKIDADARRMEHEKLIKQMEINANIEIAEIKSFSFVDDQDSNNDNIPDQLQIEKVRSDSQIKNRQLDLEEKKLAQEKELKNKEIDVKRIQARKKLSSSNK